MENTNHDTAMPQKKTPFTLQLLLQNLYEDIYKQEEEKLQKAESKREVNHLIRLLHWSLCYFQDFDGLEDADIRNLIESEVAKNDVLFAYTYYLSLNENFNYNWSYLRKQMEGYRHFIFRFYKYIQKVVECLNLLYADLKDCHALIIEFNDFLKIQFAGKTVKEVRYMLEWSQFKKIDLVEKEFYVTVWCEDNALFCWCEKQRENREQDIKLITATISRLYSSYIAEAGRKETEK